MTVLNTPARYALVSVAASLVTMALKFWAYWMTGSVGIFSDAAESVINLAAGLVTFTALVLAARPADKRHTYGHDKAEYFASGVEGTLILIASVAIFYTALQRLFAPEPLMSLGLGAAVLTVAAMINLGAARLLLHGGRKFDSIALEADAKHLMTDVWTSLAVILGVAVIMAAPEEWVFLDPLIAMAVAVNILRSGLDLLRRSWSGLMDHTLPSTEIQIIKDALHEQAPDAPFHGLRSRKSGSKRFIDVHLLIPGKCTVKEAHDLCDRIEKHVESRLDNASLTIHVEPVEEDSSWDGHCIGGVANDGSDQETEPGNKCS
ncbi:cation diffusion facilitator family transporter [Desulfonatronum thiosulfatophilum]|uniref:Cation diffusion facilitator family transporter n=1 Tax=Desulfonatronum thiosulfatophilum TaxID=617002 RepID=A0A1G6BE20_9BACT|nr:cation diffusion facilitator family transporter [Desulfonatronum thiosulfatophilum]SDB18816.1 cation diffusion facilitator family transporter [Desulfonatronum thiosulfatophilum]